MASTTSGSAEKRQISDTSSSTSPTSAKKRHLDDSSMEASEVLNHFGEINVTRILSKNLRSKSLFLLATLDRQSMQNDNTTTAAAAGTADAHELRDADEQADPDKSNEDKAVILLEKTAFSEESLPLLVSNKACMERSMQNDIYGVYECFPPRELAGFKATVIYPASEKHIEKYSMQDLHLINETYQDYQDITLPFIEKKQLATQWVINILEKKAEADRIVFEDPDPETGFVMLPDMKWDQKQVSNLYLIVIVHSRKIRSIRDLDSTHLPLLHNIQDKCTDCIAKKFKIGADQLRAYVHYQPSYYHFHVHFTHIMFDAPGTNVGRAHLLSSVIENIEMLPTYYQQKPLAYVLRDSDELYRQFKEARLQKDGLDES